MAALRALAYEDRLAVVVVLHDLNLAARYADEAWLLHEGQCVCQGTVGEVLEPARLEAVYGLRLRRVAMDAHGSAGGASILVPASSG